MEIPVYLFTGFLESGKTKMIVDTLSDTNFNTGERFLVIACEEGIEEYPEELTESGNIFVEYIDDESELTVKKLAALEKKYSPERIMIEYNGMWMLNTLYSHMPENWVVYQELMFADSKSFASYNSNMRQLVVDKLSSCEMIIFNRSTDSTDREEFHKIVRSVSTKVTIGYETLNGEFEYDDIEDPLPFNIEADIIEIADKDYAVWYRNMCEKPDTYKGKTLKFKGICAKDPALPDNKFAIGRHVMTCCVDDIQYCPVICVYDKARSIKTEDWVTVTAKFSFEYEEMYESEGPVLTAITVEKAKKPEQVVATFY